MPTLITAATLKAATRDQKKGMREDISDSRIPGLQLRVKPQGCRWTFRCRVHGIQKRFDLGPMVESDDDLEGLSLRTARERAMRVGEMARKGQDPSPFLRALTGHVSMETQIRMDREERERREAEERAAAEAAAAPASWTWEVAKERFLDEVKRVLRKDTLRDYSGKLKPAELDVFNGRLVNGITRNEMAKAIAGIHARGKETMAAGVVRTVKRMFTWMAEASQQGLTAVANDQMAGLAAPAKTRAEDGEVDVEVDDDGNDVEIIIKADEDEEEGDAPPELEIGRALVMAQQGYFPERISLGIQFLIGTVQRRRTVTHARRKHFAQVLPSNTEQMWKIPPYFRKTGRKRGKRYHLVPIIGFAAVALRELERLADQPETNPLAWLFPAGRTAKRKFLSSSSDLFNDYFTYMPGVDWSPHHVRYAFATYGERDLGFAKGEGALILDHLEGEDRKNTTLAFYSSDPGMKRKREMMVAWAEWCETWAQKAIAEDPYLLDHPFMMETIYRARYGEERLERKIAAFEKMGMKPWGGPIEDDDEDLQQAAE